MRRDRLQRPPLAQGFAHQPELGIAQIAQAAMHQLGIVGRGGGSEIVPLDQGDLQAARRGIAGGEAAGGAAADDEEVELFVGKPGKVALHAPEGIR